MRKVGDDYNLGTYVKLSGNQAWSVLATLQIEERVLEREGERNTLRSEGRAAPTQKMSLRDAIKLYQSVGRRNIEYFMWIHDVYSWICLPSVSFDYRKVLGEDKTKLTIFDILVDDLADNSATRNYTLLEQIMEIPWREKADMAERDEYLDVARRIWKDSISSVSCYPRFNEFERIFYFDLRQVLSSMLYNYLTNTVGLDNPIETSFYSSYGCLVVAAMDMDLMCSPSFDMRELGRVRTIACLAQRVAHVGNMLTTYPREVLELDVSCPIISLAIRKGIIRKDELGDKTILPKISKLEWVFKGRAHSYIQKVATYEKEIRSINIRGFSDFLTELIDRFEGSRSLR